MQKKGISLRQYVGGPTSPDCHSLNPSRDHNLVVIQFTRCILIDSGLVASARVSRLFGSRNHNTLRWCCLKLLTIVKGSSSNSEALLNLFLARSKTYSLLRILRDCASLPMCCPLCASTLPNKLRASFFDGVMVKAACSYACNTLCTSPLLV